MLKNWTRIVQSPSIFKITFLLYHKQWILMYNIGVWDVPLDTCCLLINVTKSLQLVLTNHIHTHWIKPWIMLDVNFNRNTSPTVRFTLLLDNVYIVKNNSILQETVAKWDYLQILPIVFIMIMQVVFYVIMDWCKQELVQVLSQLSPIVWCPYKT